jgi:hypothetical protein
VHGRRNHRQLAVKRRRAAVRYEGVSIQMLSHQKPVAALAAVTAALVIAVPAASASAAANTPTVDPTVCQLLNPPMGPFGPAQFIGGASLANVLANAGASVGCAPPGPPAVAAAHRSVSAAPRLAHAGAAGAPR